MPKVKTEDLPKHVREYWEQECRELTPECIRLLSELIDKFKEVAWNAHLGALKPKPDEEARRNIESAYRHVYETIMHDVIAPELAHKAYEEEVARHERWFSEATAERISEALTNALAEGYHGRDVIESVLAQTGLSIVTVRHYLYELSREIPEYSELATVARQMEREILGR
mgnify:FL=1